MLDRAGWAGNFHQKMFGSQTLDSAKEREREREREAAPAWPGLETASSVVGGGKESRKFLLITVKTSFSPLPSTLQMFAKTHFTSAAANGKIENTNNDASVAKKRNPAIQ